MEGAEAVCVCVPLGARNAPVEVEVSPSSCSDCCVQIHIHVIEKYTQT